MLVWVVKENTGLLVGIRPEDILECPVVPERSAQTVVLSSASGCEGKGQFQPDEKQ